MQLTVSGKNINVGDSLRSHIQTTLTSISEKYFSNPIEATIIVSKEAFNFRVDTSVHIGKGIVIRCHANHDDPYACVDEVINKISKRLRRHKTRLRDHHKPETHNMQEELTLQQFVMTSDESEKEGHEGGPAIIAEITTRVMSLSLNQAIMHLDLSEQQLLMFKNSTNGQINVVFRRPDGNIGWMDPSLAK